MQDIPLFYIFTGLTVFAFIYFYFKSQKNTPSEEKELISEKKLDEKKERKVSSETNPKNLSLKELKKLNAHSDKEKKNKSKKKVANPDHPSYFNSFKGFADQITDFNISKNFIILSSLDHSIKIFKLNQLKEENPFFYMHNLGVNYATSVSFSIFSEKYLVCGLSAERTIELFEFVENDTSKKYLQSKKKFPSNIHKESIRNAYYLNNTCIVTFGGGNDTTLKVWNSSCELLNTIDTKQVKHNYSCISSTGRFIFIGTWCPDIKVMEIKLEKSDKSFKNLSKIMDLGLHKAGIDYISCSINEDKVLTISQDKNVRIWNINVEYEKKSDPKCLLTIDMKKNQLFNGEVDIKAGDVYSFSNDSEKTIFALAEKNNIIIVSLASLKILDIIERAHSEESEIKGLKFVDFDGKILLMSCGGDDCRVNVFNINI